MYPTHCWYVAATSAEVTGTPLGRRALGRGLVLYRTPDGRAVALEDRDAHAPYPLSLGLLEGDLIVSSYSGFAYAPDGRCVRVPTQAEVPYDADITHVAVVDPVIAPPALSAGPMPRLDVEVSETSVGFARDYPPAPVAKWHAPLLGVGEHEPFAQREEGRFVTPGLWVDSWHVHLGGRTCTFRFTHGVTPVDDTTTRHVWRVSRNFAPDADLTPLFREYYQRVKDILETMQRVLDADGPRPLARVAADAAAIQVRKIVGRMVADEKEGL